MPSLLQPHELPLAQDLPRPTHIIVELGEGTGFSRVVLGRAAVEEHQCRAYRRVLTQLAMLT
ncbi:hypothetical protein TSOC_002078 [Tetrabaena socialis]|uniref:Uncharacterized protein n=1 Tax=Tetrabaena socialis TaxID=47790 RepID=A0A2J8AF13_9CHLO|nr:hypothetical protein TSOC_002078 [Tetrabaena socialis]|eukprot:PNH11100.1 hypothetical protein TSOC_002078 [Tetrabaena socialis]